MQKHVRMEAFQLLRQMTLSKTINETVKRSIRLRLETICEAEEAAYQRWQENIAHKLRPTRQAQVRREFEKRIKAYKITIWNLTPYSERGPEPVF